MFSLKILSPLLKRKCLLKYLLRRKTGIEETTVDREFKLMALIWFSLSSNSFIESKGSIRTGKGSFVKGDVKAFEAVINGNVKGDVIVNGKVTLGPHSYLMGNLTAGILLIKEGARCDGLCNMVKSPGSKTMPLVQQNQSEG